MLFDRYEDRETVSPGSKNPAADAFIESSIDFKTLEEKKDETFNNDIFSCGRFICGRM